MQEKTLFEEIRNGNIEMFGILFKKYFGSMCVIAKSFISDTQAAEDIVQDIFIRLWEKRREYEGFSVCIGKKSLYGFSQE